MLALIHRHLRERLARDGGGRIDEIYFAPDPPWAPTERRKPGAGMLREAMAHFRVAPADTVFIGDSLVDLQAGTTAGRSEERRVGKEGVSTCRSRWSP